MNAQDQINNTTQTVERQESLVNRVADAQKALELAATAYKQSWREWMAITENMLPECRSWRMAVDTELTKSLSGFRDVRQFFLSEDHVPTVARLKEFVELCERLQKLKESGFLDRVADTMLKFEEKL